MFQIAADMVGQGSQRNWQEEIQSSILENAAELRASDAYEEYYFMRYGGSA